MATTERHRRLLDGLGTRDYQEAHRQISVLGNEVGITDSQLLSVLDDLPRLVKQYPGSYVVPYSKETITWYGFESLIWTLGESVRRLLKRNKALRRSAELWKRVEAVCLDARYGKGRESFTMLLGQYGGQGRIPTLLRLLEDPELQGHSLYALRILGAEGAQGKAEKLLLSPRSWIRSEARKYLQKVAK